MTAQVLGAPPKGRPVARKSETATVVLDLLSPSIAAGYALAESPYVHGFGGLLATRIINETLASEFVVVGALGLSQWSRLDSLYQVNTVVLLTVGILNFILARVGALLTDVAAVRAGNIAADRGLVLDGVGDPWRLADP